MITLAQEMPFAEISIGDIAACAQVGPATFYRHYKDKNALLADVAGDFIRELALKITPVAVATDSPAAAISLCRFVDERREVCTALLSGGAKSVIFDRLLEQAVDHVETSGMEKESWVPASLGPVYMVTSVLTLLGWWLHRGTDYTPEEMSVLIDRLALMPVLSSD